MTHSVNLNSGLLKQVFTTAKRANQGKIYGFKFRLQNRTIFLNERDLNTALHFPMENFDYYPTNEELLGFFTWIQCSLDENNMIPRVIYQNHLPKEWHLFFTIVSHVFAPKISGFHGVSKMIQIIRFSIAHNMRINLGHLIMEEIIKNQKYARENYCLYPRFLQIALEHRLTEAQQGIYARSRLIEPSVLSLRPAMVLLNNAHYPNVVLPARVTNFIQDFFNTLDLVDEVEQVGAGEDQEEGDDGDSDSSPAQSGSLDLDQPGPSGVHKSPEMTNTPEAPVAEEFIAPEQAPINKDQVNLLNFDLSEFFGSEYLSFLDSFDPSTLPISQPSMAISTSNEFGNPPVLTHAEEQQTLSLFAYLSIKRKPLYVNERVNHKSPKTDWFNVFVLEETTLPPLKMRKLDHEATVNLDSIQSPKTNTSPIQISEDELMEEKGGDTDSKQPSIILSNVSTSPESPSTDPKRDIPRSDLSGEVRQLSGNSSSDESDRVFHTQNPSQGHEGNVGSPLPHTILPTLPLPEGTFPGSEKEIPPTQSDGGRQVLGKSSSDKPSTIFFAGTSVAAAGMSVSETPTERLSVHKSPQTQKTE